MHYFRYVIDKDVVENFENRVYFLLHTLSIYRQTDRQVDKYIDNQKEIDRQKDREIDRQRETDRYIDR